MSELHDMVKTLADRACEMRMQGLLSKPDDVDHRCPEEWPGEPERWCLVCSARVFLDKPAEKLVPESIRTLVEKECGIAVPIDREGTAVWRCGLKVGHKGQHANAVGREHEYVAKWEKTKTKEELLASVEQAREVCVRIEASRKHEEERADDLGRQVGEAIAVVARAREKREEAEKALEVMKTRPAREVHFVIGQPGPSHKSGRFIELENEKGEGLGFGEWKEIDNLWHLVIPYPDVEQVRAEVEDLKVNLGEAEKASRHSMNEGVRWSVDAARHEKMSEDRRLRIHEIRDQLEAAERKGKLLAHAYGMLLLAAQRHVRAGHDQHGELGRLLEPPDIRLIPDSSVPEGTLLFVNPHTGEELGRVEGLL